MLPLFDVRWLGISRARSSPASFHRWGQILGLKELMMRINPKQSILKHARGDATAPFQRGGDYPFPRVTLFAGRCHHPMFDLPRSQGRSAHEEMYHGLKAIPVTEISRVLDMLLGFCYSPHLGNAADVEGVWRRLSNTAWKRWSGGLEERCLSGQF